MRCSTGAWALAAALGWATLLGAAEPDGHWPLRTDARDHSKNGLHMRAVDVEFGGRGPGKRPVSVARFNGRTSRLELNADRLKVGAESFSWSMWVRADESGDDVSGDLVSSFDVTSRRGFHVGLKTNGGVTFSQSNVRQLQFGIDQDRRDSKWVDRGRPGNAVLAFALCVHDGQLYAGTCEGGLKESGHVYRYEGGQKWVDCGAPDQSNAVTALVEFQGRLYAGTGKYRLRGSALSESENLTLGGRIFRYEQDGTWTECGRLPEAESVGGLVVFKNELYASTLYRPAGFYRYAGDRTWIDVGVPERPQDAPGETTHMRVEALGLHDGWLYATSYDGGRVFRFDGKSWFDCGQLADNTQTYAFAVFDSRLYVGTWRSGRVYRFESPGQWTDVGRLGEELEVMGMLVHNGRLIAGTLPLAEVYQYDIARGDQPGSWQKLARLDETPDVMYRRAWTMAEYDGQVFCSTLPSGRIYSWRSGRVAMVGRRFPEGWHHVVAVRTADELRLYMDGQLAASEKLDSSDALNLSIERPLQIGAGPNAGFHGELSDVRFYRRALTEAEVRELAVP